ncbi:probable serine hydrolase isoform X2 [Halyomorpha halys]|uniref:probable serine hydrolase isoform X2 n=1 Tax=Halyomorpha halys TaxID=286706 RepID=UPI0006D51FA7|nr:probable serine hydrolase isoform X2 [Halyomorpha halys]
MCSLRSGILRRFSSQRCFHTTQVQRIDPKTVEEIKIPVPWGHIAGKWWGKKSIQPVLAVHGWQDNAGSWDPIAELMPDDYSLFAIDLPGNGRSSHLPPFQNYYFNDAVAVLRRIKLHFNWDKVDLLGHSGGSATCFLYAAVFPEDVNSYFGIDYLVGSYGDEKKRAARIGKTIDKKIELALREHSSSKRYTWEEAKNVWIKATKDSLDDKSAEILMQRGLDKLPDGKFIFSRDHRLKGADINLLNEEQLYMLAGNASVHVRLVRGSKSEFFDSGIKYCPEALNIVKKNAKSYNLYDLDGKHHLHMDIPEKIVPLLIEVLKAK